MGKAISCIVLAAGAGRRMGYKENKIFIPLGDILLFNVPYRM